MLVLSYHPSETTGALWGNMNSVTSVSELVEERGASGLSGGAIVMMTNMPRLERAFSHLMTIVLL